MIAIEERDPARHRPSRARAERGEGAEAGFPPQRAGGRVAPLRQK